MDSQAFKRARELALWTDADIVRQFRVQPSDIRDWEAGNVPIPRAVVTALSEVGSTLAIADRVDREIAARALPECSWMRDEHVAGHSMTVARLKAHAMTCPTCAARLAIADHLRDEQRPKGLLRYVSRWWDNLWIR